MVLRAAQDWLLLLRLHRRAALLAFAASLLLFLALAAIWPKQFRGSALLSASPDTIAISEQNGHTLSAQSQDDQVLPPTVLLQQKESMVDWAGIVSTFGLYPDRVASGGLAQAARQLATQVSIRQSADTRNGEAAFRIDYQGPDRQIVLGVVDAVAETLTRAGPSASPGEKSSLAPLYAPVVLPTVPVSAQKMTREHHTLAGAGKNSIAYAELNRRLQASLAEGANLQQASDQNAHSLNQLHEQLASEQAKPAKAPPSVPQRAPEDPQLTRLHQQLIQEQHRLVDLQARYTDQYPDVVASRDRIRDLQLDISRIAAVDAHTVAQQPVPAVHVALRDPQLVASLVNQVNQAETARDTLQKAMQINQDQTARLRTQLELKEAAAAKEEASSEALDADTPEQDSPASAVAGLTASQAVSNEPPAAPAQASASPSGDRLAPASSFFLTERPTVAATPVVFAYPLSLLLGFAFGAFAAFAAAWLAERRDPSIRNERMLRRVLPNSAVYLGGIPRIRHEVVVE